APSVVGLATVFGAGGGTSSYEETRAADLIVLWGSNAREAHPIFFHHVLKAVNRGAQLIVVDPRRTPSAQWADLWLGLDVGTDIPLANGVGREIIAAGLADLEFVERATTDFEAYRESVEPWTLDAAWGSAIPPQPGLHLTAMFEAMERGELRALYVVGENPAQGEADQQRAQRLLEGLDHLVVQDLFLTRTAEFADVVLPAAATLGEVEGTVTSSERRVQRVRKAYDPPGEARDDIEIVYDLARRLGHDLGSPRAEDVWDECRSLSPMHAGMSYARLDALGGIQWPCWDDEHPGSLFIHDRLWADVVEE